MALLAGGGVLVVGAIGGIAFAFSGGKDDDEKLSSAEKKERRDGWSNRAEGIHGSLVDFAGQRLAETGKDKSIARSLERAGSQLRPSEFVLIFVAISTLLFLLGTILVNPILGIVLALFGALIGKLYLSIKTSKRQNAFADQLVETLQMLAGSLRSGLGVNQALGAVAEEADSPTTDEVQRVLNENRLGRDLSESLRDMAKRVGSDDWSWVVNAIDAHREVGGDLAKILDRAGATIRARNRVRGQVQALSAEGKLSGIILIGLPPGIGLIMWLLNREYMELMYQTAAGWIMIILATVLLLVGGLVIKKIATFKY